LNARQAGLRTAGGIAACVGYGALVAFLVLIGTQLWWWFRDGEWTGVDVSNGLHGVLLRCCVRDGSSGALANLVQWLDSPLDWHGLHHVFEVLPASLLLFAVSILGNCLFILCKDRLEGR
jgi:hypothetical protein